MIDFKKLERALELDGGKHTVQDVADMIERGDAKLWVNGDSLVITQVVSYPQDRTLNFWIASGDLDEVRAMLPQIYEYGYAMGCSHAETTCRRGWARVMANDGWQEAKKLVVMRRSL